jgi:hypothetical protein
MYRHVRQRCKTADKVKGTETPAERALQEQLAALERQNTEQNTKIDRLATLVELCVLGGHTGDDEALASHGRGPAQASITTNNAPVGQQCIQNNTTNIITFGDAQCTEEGRGSETALPGWPAKWPPPAVLPRPFFPPSFTISLEDLREALAACPDAEACRRGDPEAIAALMVGILRRVHADPRERNMYPNPNRADQTLVYNPERWDARAVLEAVRIVFSRVADELAEALPFVTPPLQSLADAAQAGYRAKKSEVAKSSRAPMAAHLENMAALARAGEAGDCWLGNLSGQQEIELPRMFGQERHGHLPADKVVSDFELAFGVYSAEGLVAASLPEFARRALKVFAQRLLKDHPENLTVVLADDGAAHVHTPRGWKALPVAEAARQQAEAFARVIVLYLATPGAAHLAPVGHYIMQNLEALAAEESQTLGLLKQYARAAAEYYPKTTGPTLAEPRRLLFAIAPPPASAALPAEGPPRPGEPTSTHSGAHPRERGLC